MSIIGKRAVCRVAHLLNVCCSASCVGCTGAAGTDCTTEPVCLWCCSYMGCITCSGFNSLPCLLVLNGSGAAQPMRRAVCSCPNRTEDSHQPLWKLFNG